MSKNNKPLRTILSHRSPQSAISPSLLRPNDHVRHSLFTLLLLFSVILVATFLSEWPFNTPGLFSQGNLRRKNAQRTTEGTNEVFNDQEANKSETSSTSVTDSNLMKHLANEGGTNDGDQKRNEGSQVDLNQKMEQDANQAEGTEQRVAVAEASMISEIVNDPIEVTSRNKIGDAGSQSVDQSEKSVEETGGISTVNIHVRDDPKLPFADEYIDTGTCVLDDTSPIPVTHNGNKTLVVIIGSIRGGEPAWNSLYRNVLDVNHADLAVLAGRPSNADTYPGNSTLFQRAKYDWSFDEPGGDWSNELNSLLNDMMTDYPSLKDVDLEERRKWLFAQSYNGVFGPVDGKVGSAAINIIIRYWLSKKIRELNLLEQYERFVITRSDHFYACVHDLTSLDNNMLWTPSGNDEGGLCDRHAVVSNKLVLPSLDLFTSLFRNPEPYLKGFPTMNPEFFLKFAWQVQCIMPYAHSKFDRMMFTCGHSGDQTRWKSYTDEVDVGNGETVFLKYEDEYAISMATCKSNLDDSVQPKP